MREPELRSLCTSKLVLWDPQLCCQQLLSCAGLLTGALDAVVNIGRKMLQAQLPAPALQTSKAVTVASPAASQCWDLSFRVLLASNTSQPLSRQNPNVTAFEGYSRLSRMDSLSSQQGLQASSCGRLCSGMQAPHGAASLQHAQPPSPAL